jgi:hypothetical protein
MQNPYDKEWDDKLKRLLKNCNFTNIGAHSAILGNSKIWISNHPYASFTDYETPFSTGSMRPSRLTILKANKKLKKDMILDLGCVKSRGEMEREHIEELLQIQDTIKINQEQIREITEKIRNHPDNLLKYKKKNSLLNNSRVRKHTMKYK